jgi:hypothetical protein
MSALSITAAQVLLVSGPTKEVTLGATVTQGQVVYFDDASGKWKLAQCDGTAAEAGASGYGLALSAGADGQKGVIALPGAKVTLGAGAAPAAGTVYAIGSGAGGINPVADLASTNKVTALGVGVGSNAIRMLGESYDAGAVLA